MEEEGTWNCNGGGEGRKEGTYYNALPVINTCLLVNQTRPIEFQHLKLGS